MDLPEIVYRKALPGDGAEIARLSSQLGYPVEEGQIRDRLSRILDNSEHAVYVAELGGTLAGWVHVHGRLLLESAPFAEIAGLVVDDRYRGRSLGKHLTSLCEEWARVEGFLKIRVRTNEKRTDAMAFYSRIGYKTVKAQQIFDKELF